MRTHSPRHPSDLGILTCAVAIGVSLLLQGCGDSKSPASNADASSDLVGSEPTSDAIAQADGMVRNDGVTTPDLGITMDSRVIDVRSSDVQGLDAAIVAPNDASGSLDVSSADAKVANTDANSASALHVQSVAVGTSNMCVVLPDQTVACCGYNASGQLGLGSTALVSTPTVVPNLAGVSSVYVSGNATCAILADTSLRCWGINADGELGTGTVSQMSSSPVSVPGMANVVAMAMGGHATCALLQGGEVDCWGANNAGQLGNGTLVGPDTASTGQPCNATPGRVAALGQAVAIAAGGDHVCALLSDKTVACWGLNTFGQLGDGTSTTHASPVVVPTLTDVVAITAGLDHTCALLAAGTVKCWGQNTFGQLGNGTTTTASIPVDVLNLSGVTAISSHVAAQGPATCALLADGTVACWGINSGFQIGNGSTTPSYPTPIAVPGIADVKAISVGGNGACAQFADGTLECWGNVGLEVGTAKTPQTVSAAN